MYVVYTTKPIPHLRGVYYIYVPKKFSRRIERNKRYIIIITDDINAVKNVVAGRFNKCVGDLMEYARKEWGVRASVLVADSILQHSNLEELKKLVVSRIERLKNGNAKREALEFIAQCFNNNI